MVASVITSGLVRTAHGDAWQVEGLLREPFGGGVGRVRRARLMASGIDHPQWNNADVDDPESVDVVGMREWYTARSVPWGVRVPAGVPWSYGRFLFDKRLMGVALSARGLARASFAGLVIRRAGPEDLDAVLHVDLVGFPSAPTLERQWIQPHLSSPAVEVALAVMSGEPVGTAYTVRSDGWAGPALYLAGVTVLPEARRRGIAGAVSSWLLRRGATAGARLAHLHPDSDQAARVYARLGFVEVDGFDVYVDL
jgi:GNAT superfamily N-acetyltransferase